MLLFSGDGAALLPLAASESPPPQAAVIVSADTTTVAAAILFMVRIAFPLVGIGCVPCSVGDSRSGAGRMGPSARYFADVRQVAVTFTLCQPVDPLGAMETRFSVCV